jgi:hypothetical protein
VRAREFASRCLSSLSVAVSGATMLTSAASAEPAHSGESAQSVIDDEGRRLQRRDRVRTIPTNDELGVCA